MRRETMIQCDVGVSRIRRILMKEAEAQAPRLHESAPAQAAE